MSEKCFNIPVENALCGCQFVVNLGKTRGIPLLDIDPQRKGFFEVPDVCAQCHQNRLKIATVRARTDRQTDRQTDDRGDLIML